MNNTFTELHQFKTFQNPKNRDSYHKLPFNQSMLFLGYCLFLQSLSTILSNYLTLGCFSFTLYVQLEACSYTLLDIIPVISFHMRGKHEIGWQLPTALLWPKSFLARYCFLCWHPLWEILPVVHHMIHLCCHSFMECWKILQPIILDFIWSWTFLIGSILCMSGGHFIPWAGPWNFEIQLNSKEKAKHGF